MKKKTSPGDRDIFCCAPRKLVILLAKTRGTGRHTGKTVDKTELQRDEFFQELKRIRESKGLRLEDIAQRYKIRPSFLESIESGSFEDLPEPVYTKTFIKTYAGLLGVDTGPILARYAKYIEKTMPAPPPEAPKEQIREARTENAIFDRLGSMGGRLGWAVLTLAVVVILGIYVFQDSGERPVPAKSVAREAVKPAEKPPETPPAEAPQAPAVQQPDAASQQQAAVQTAVPQAAPTQTAAPEEKKPEAPPPAQKKEPPPPAPTAAGALSLTIEATEAAWVQVESRQDAGRAKTHAGGGKADNRGEGQDHRRSRKCGRCPDHLPGTIPGEPREARRSDTPGLPGGKAHGEEETRRVETGHGTGHETGHGIKSS